MRTLQIIEGKPDFGANIVRYLRGLNLNAVESSDCLDNHPCILDYQVVCYMASLDSSLNTIDRPTMQRLFRLAVWDASQFIASDDSSSAAGLVNLMYAIYNKPESLRGALPGVTLPVLTGDEKAALARLVLPPELIPVVQSVQTALSLTSRQ
jgi:hypothetical protein